MIFRITILTLILILGQSQTLSAQFKVIDSNIPYEYKSDLEGSGIETIYFIKTITPNTKLQFSSKVAFVRFFKYSHSIDDSETISSANITSEKNGNTTIYTIDNLEDSKGYYAEENGAVTSAIWIFNYSRHLPIFKSIAVSEGEDKCMYLKLLIDKEDDLFFHVNNGGKRPISRLYNIEYKTMSLGDANADKYIESEKSIENVKIGSEFIVEEPPLISTKFKISGDQIGKFFNITQSKESAEYTAIKTEAKIIAEQIDEKTGEITNNIGGSAPVNVTFKGVSNEPTTYFYTWYIYNKKDLKNPIVRYTDKDIYFLFKESGQYKVVLEVADKSSICVDSSSIDLSIENFKWDIPNFLLLDGNHQFKISFQSINSFKCTIFNRWGNKIYEWTDPSKGWDGKYKGKEVNPGVYFYVMTALGGDGKKHQKSGDINVLKKK